ncbi:MAG TPA: glutamine synthetase [Cycloclasticus sp.]|jgi:glutamine synthetase|nr:glutamine synthetase [Cycloclasticus sp.]HIL91431.1 glutamine synthetase [Cycloclasticus sp.]
MSNKNENVVSSIGLDNFIAKHGLWNKEQKAAAKELVKRLKVDEIKYVRVTYCDQHGLTRGKMLPVKQFVSVLKNGLASTHAIFAMDSANNIFLPVFSEDGGFGNAEMGGAGDMVMVPDPTTFRLLPWGDHTGWVLSDLYLKSGAVMPFSPRAILAEQLKPVHKKGYELLIGLEVEFHVFKIDDPHLTMEASTQPAEPPSVSPLAHAYQYQGEQNLDEVAPLMELFHQHLTALELPIRSLEDEWGPGQCEITMEPLPAMQAADAMVLMRSTLKQLARRNGYLVTFMCKPALPNVYSSGWHLHQSLVDIKTGKNIFATSNKNESVSAIGLQYIAGLIEHARACTAFSNPTINGYKRMNSNALAPNRAVWSVDNKAACLRLANAGDPSVHIENRSGEPAANPYLFFASQLAAGMDGINKKRDPGPPLNDPYAQTDKTPLPASLMEAITALDESKLLRDAIGDTYIGYYLSLKRHEIHRFLSTVTDWEHKEYFERF